MFQVRTVIAALLFVCIGLSANAQKFGYINSAELIEVHPSVESANKMLEEYRNELTKAFEDKVRSFQTKYQIFAQDVQSGTLSKVVAESRQADLAKEQEDLGQEEQKLQLQILQKRESLLQPILNEVDAVIKSIGKEGSYTMIFDTSANGGLIWADESEDLTQQAKDRLIKK